MKDTPPHGAPNERMSWLVIALLALAAAVSITTMTSRDTGTAFGAFALEFLRSAPLAGLWLLAAAGLGGPLAKCLLPEHPDRRWLALPLGIAALLVIDNVLGRVGLLDASAIAWAVLIIGAGLAIAALVRATQPRARMVSGWLTLPVVIPATVLLVAAATAPGWLWASEFGGYDALSYHLQLPREWIEQGRITGLEHNVYGFLPSYAESAFVHLAVLRGDAVAAAPAMQFLHAMITLATALVTARLAARHGGALAGTVAAALVLGTPWTVVVGSLAYDEMITALLLAAGLLVLDMPSRGLRTGVAIGLLAGVAVGAKLTAAGFVLAPLLVLLVGSGENHGMARVRVAVVAAATAGSTLLPWLIGNFVDSGSPTFPFLTGLFGTAHWSAEQAQRWIGGHGADLGALERIGAAWRQLFTYGFGSGPPGEPWWPQWSVLPWLAVLGGAVAGATRATQSRAVRYGVVLAIQIIFWLAATHVKSRFMLPAVVPAALLVTLAVHAVVIRRADGASHMWVVATIAAGVYAIAPLLLFARELDGNASAAIGAIPLFRGDTHAAALEEPREASVRATILDTAPPAYWIGHALDDTARVLLVGDATPFYLPLDRIEYVTVWDRGPVSAALDAAGDAPHAWIGELREQGYTHLLVDPVMLDLWSRAQWGDPRMTAVDMTTGAAAEGTLVRQLGAGKALYRIDARSLRHRSCDTDS